VKFPHERFADDGAGDFLLAPLLQIAFDTISDRIDGIDTDRPFLTGALEPVDDLDPVVALASTVFLDHHRHHFLDPLVGCKAPIAAGAFPPAPNHIAVLAQARIDDAIIRLVTERTLHTAYLTCGVIIDRQTARSRR